MVTFTCDCGKNFNNKQSAKHHLEDSHKEEILDLEVRLMYKSTRRRDRPLRLADDRRRARRHRRLGPRRR
jgi:hypothetical protein